MKKFIRSIALVLALCVALTFSMTAPVSAAAKAKKPGKPTITSIFKFSASSSQITWKKVKNAKKYEVYVSVNGKKFKKAGTTKQLFYQQKKLKAGAAYRYKVRAVNGKKKGKFSAVKYLPRTLQEYMKNNPEENAKVQQSGAANNCVITFVKNEIIYSYDMAKQYPETDKEILKNAAVSALNSSVDTYKGVAANVEKESFISGIKVTVKYLYGSEVLASKSYNKNGAL